MKRVRRLIRYTKNLIRIQQARLAEQVARYCESVPTEEDNELVAIQAFPRDEES
jgi:hypothetical protein